jgi:hypothetical protein
MGEPVFYDEEYSPQLVIGDGFQVNLFGNDSE